MVKTPRRRLPHVALLIETTRSYGRNVIRGIGEYAKVHGPWILYLDSEKTNRAMPSPGYWDGDGIIAQPQQNAALIEALAKSGKPVVSLSGPPGLGGFPAVRPNQQGVADIAMQHFRDRGFTRFAYCGAPAERVWPPLGKLFKQLAEDAGYNCEIYTSSFDPDEHNLHLEHMAKWLRGLKKPVAMLVGNDQRARDTLDACRLAELHVPEEIAVLGVNDDELFCEVANPPLSSVMHNSRRIGFEAAAMLAQLMQRKPVPPDLVIDPLGVHARQSTDLLAIEDAEVAKAVRYIREHACQGIRVDDVLQQVALSRRAFEKRFRTAVGRPPHVEIRRMQLERVKELLTQTDYKLDKIAEITGFSTAQYLAGLFHRMMDVTPGAWRAAGKSARISSHP